MTKRKEYQKEYRQRKEVKEQRASNARLRRREVKKCIHCSKEVEE